MVFEQVRQKLTYTVIERSYKLEISDLKRNNVYYPCSDNKSAHQPRGYRLLFSHYADCLFSHEAAHMLHYAVLMGASIVYILD